MVFKRYNVKILWYVVEFLGSNIAVWERAPLIATPNKGHANSVIHNEDVPVHYNLY